MKDNEQIIDRLGYCNKSYAYTLRDDGDKVVINNHEYSAYRIVYNDLELGEGGLACFYSVIENTYVDYDSVVVYSHVKDSVIVNGSLVQNMNLGKYFDAENPNEVLFGLSNCLVDSSRLIDKSGMSSFNRCKFTEDSNVIDYRGSNLELIHTTLYFNNDDAGVGDSKFTRLTNSFVTTSHSSTVKSFTDYKDFIMNNENKSADDIKKQSAFTKTKKQL